MAISLPPIGRQRAKRKEYHGNLVHGRRKRAQAANSLQGMYANIGTMTCGTLVRCWHTSMMPRSRSSRATGRRAVSTAMATVDQLLCKAPAVLDVSGTLDGFNNLGGVISWIKSLSASVSNGLRSILKFEGAIFAASL